MDSFNYLTEDFSQPFFAKLSIHFLEIWYTIFKNFTPQQIISPQEGQKEAWDEIEAQERQRERRLQFLKGCRHSKFGSQLQVMRSDGSSAIVNSVY